MALDKHLWKERNHVTVADLCEWFPRYLYLPRVKGRETLVRAVQEGAAVMLPDDTFATAEAYDGANERYMGLRIGSASSIINNGTCIIKTAVALKQQEDDAQRSASKPDRPEEAGETPDAPYRPIETPPAGGPVPPPESPAAS